jgi:hypothetical protein
VGCWHCDRPAARCRECFSPPHVASLILRLVGGDAESPGRLRLPAQELLVSGRDAFGLYALRSLPAGRTRGPREHIGRFWQAFFGQAFGLMPHSALSEAWAAFVDAAPSLLPPLDKGLARLSRRLAEGLRGAKNAGIHADDFWRQSPPLLHPLSGYLHLLLQNNRYSRDAYARSLNLAEELAALPR